MKLGIVLSGLLGLAISSGTPIGLAFSILAPVVWLQRGSRSVCYISAFAYYLAALRSLPVVSRNFFGPESGLLNGLCLWMVSAALLSLPWLWAWSTSPIAALWKCPLALLASIVPPLGLIGWASPVTAAGLLFPSAGYAGFALTLCLPSILLIGRKLTLLVLLSVTAAGHFRAGAKPKPPGDWEAVETHFGAVAHSSIDVLREYEICQRIQFQAVHSQAHVVIFPEAVVPRWTDATDLFWSETTTSLSRAGKTMLVGAVRPDQSASASTKLYDFTAALAALELHNIASGRLPVSAKKQVNAHYKYSNSVMIRGIQSGDFRQRVPIPFGMWRPFTGGGVPLNLTGPGTIQIGVKKVALIICYEQLITWPVLMSFIEGPTMIVTISNNYWVSATDVPAIERTTMQAWADLFNVPVMCAANW